MTHIYVIAITYRIFSLLLLSEFAYITFRMKRSLIFISSSKRDFLDNFFDLFREYHVEI